MKIDLDELERKVREASDNDEPDIPISYREALALIARIRELEGALMACIGTLHYGGYDTDDARMVRDNGVVLP